jgi:hypothetical protein
MRKLQIIFLVGLLGVSAAADFAQADESPPANGQVKPNAGADGSATLVASDAGVDQLPALAPDDSQPHPVDAGLANIGNAVVHLDAGMDAEEFPKRVANSISVQDPSKREQKIPVVAMRATAVSSDGLPLLGVMVDVGVPDGLMASLVVRPWNWMRVSAGGGTNSISNGWRAGISLLPLGSGPSASLEYGRYQDGDANSLAKKFVGSGFDRTPALDRVGYEFMNAHLGLDFGSRSIVFFIHGGVTMLRGQIHNLNAVSGGAGGTGTTEVVVRQDPNFKAVGPSFKLGLLCYIW